MEIRLTKDWTELLQLLTEFGVDFVVIGAFALAHHGIPRVTGDIDVLYDPEPGNCTKLFEALRVFGVPVQGLSVQDLITPEATVTFGRPPNRIDLLNWLSGSSWEDVASDRERGWIGDLEVWFPSRRAYLANKAASGRPKDLADIEAVRRLHSEGQGNDSTH